MSRASCNCYQTSETLLEHYRQSIGGRRYVRSDGSIQKNLLLVQGHQ